MKKNNFLNVDDPHEKGCYWSHRRYRTDKITRNQRD